MTLDLTKIELKALWLIADAGYALPFPELERDPFLESAAHRALEKVYRAHTGKPHLPEAA
jgi:hypothetical protein